MKAGLFQYKVASGACPGSQGIGSAGENESFIAQRTSCFDGILNMERAGAMTTKRNHHVRSGLNEVACAAVQPEF